MYIIFSAAVENIDLWCDILTLLENDPAGANSGKMAVFGEPVDEVLEKLIDEYGVEEAFVVEFWGHDETVFNVMIHSLNSEHKVALTDLLSKCPITNLHFGEDPDW